MTTADTARDLATFLDRHVEIATIAHAIVTPEGGISVQLVEDLADEQTRVGLLYGLAVVYSGDVRIAEARQLTLDMKWRERPLRVWTATKDARQPIVPPSAPPLIENPAAIEWLPTS